MKNKLLVYSIGISFIALIAAINIPALEEFMQTTTLNPIETIICVSYASSILLIEEIRKRFFRG